MIDMSVGIIITIIAYMISVKIYNHSKISVLNPVLISVILIIASIIIFNIPYEIYEKGGNIITYILGPIVVILAIPLYKSRHTLKKYMIPVFAGIISGIVASVLSVYVLCKIFQLDIKVINSILPKSITSPMAIEVSKVTGGIVGLTVFSVVITGIVGASIAPLVCKHGKIKNEIAKGIGIGSSSHGVGTTKAVEMSDEAGAASGLAMGLTGVITVLVASVVSKLF